MLPDVDGWRIMQALRDAQSTTPVLFLTARDSVEDRVKGLELGADDYLVKPLLILSCWLVSAHYCGVVRHLFIKPRYKWQIWSWTFQCVGHSVRGCVLI